MKDLAKIDYLYLAKLIENEGVNSSGSRIIEFEKNGIKNY
jgi:hypothetical protein